LVAVSVSVPETQNTKEPQEPEEEPEEESEEEPEEESEEEPEEEPEEQTSLTRINQMNLANMDLTV